MSGLTWMRATRPRFRRSRTGRLAIDGVFDTGWAAVFWRHLYSPEDRYGRPGIGRVLLAMAQVWRERREEALESAGSVMAAIEHNESFSGRGGDLSGCAGGQDCRIGFEPVRCRATAGLARSRSFHTRRRWTCCWKSR